MMALQSVRIGVALVLVAMAGYAAAATPSGTVLAVVQSANIDGETGKKILEPEAPVYAGDRVDTGPVGEAQIRFRDNTKLVVGPNSSMVIDAFVFNDDDTAREISINAVKGAFRFITGSSRKDAYSITTPTATIGVRGTEFDISVEREGTTRIANFEGTTRICRHLVGSTVVDPKTCVEADQPCTLSIIRPTEPDVVKLSNDDVEFRNRQLKYYFRYIQSQASLRSDFQVDLAQCKFAEVAIPPGSPTPPGEVPPPTPPVPPPVPDAPVPPTFTPPPLPSPADRHDTRPVYDHGDVFR